MTKNIFEENNRISFFESIVNSSFFQNLNETELNEMSKKTIDQNIKYIINLKSNEPAINEIRKNSSSSSPSIVKIAFRLKKLTDTISKGSHLDIETTNETKKPIKEEQKLDNSNKNGKFLKILI
jgi:hypothetical protein